MSRSPIDVLVVDDNEVVRRGIASLLEEQPDMEVVGFAEDGEEALQKFRSLQPDVVTLDIMMPNMGGLSTLEQMMEYRPVPVLVISNLTEENADWTLRALERGAAGYITKGALGEQGISGKQEEIVEEIRKIAGEDETDKPSFRTIIQERKRAGELQKQRVEGESRFDLVFLLGSTGAEDSVEKIVAGLPDDYQASIVIMLPMNPSLAKAFLDRLRQRTNLPVQNIEQIEVLDQPGVYFSSTKRPFEFGSRGSSEEKEVTVKLIERASGQDQPYEVMNTVLTSAIEVFGDQVGGVVLSGIGEGPVEGLWEFVEAGGITVAESQSSAMMDEMPQSVIEQGVIDHVDSLENIIRKLAQWG